MTNSKKSMTLTVLYAILFSDVKIRFYKDKTEGDNYGGKQ